MSRYFPHTAYAEDQPLAKTILTTHILTRGVTTGTVIGGVLFGSRTLLSSIRQTKNQAASSSSSTSSSKPAKLATSNLRGFIRATGTSTAWTLAFVGLATVARMWGREDIEWKDRSWRLLENKGQLETDDWTYAGMAVGLAASALLLRRGKVMMPSSPGVVMAREGVHPSGQEAAKEILGAVSLGSFAGMMGYMGWRYGVHSGKFASE